MSGNRRLGSDPLAWMDKGRRSASATSFGPTEADTGGMPDITDRPDTIDRPDITDRPDTNGRPDTCETKGENDKACARNTFEWSQEHAPALALLHNCPVPCAAFSAQGSALYANPAFLDLLHSERTEAGCPEWEVLFPAAPLHSAEGGSLFTRLAAAPVPSMARLEVVTVGKEVFMAYVMQVEQIPEEPVSPHCQHAEAKEMADAAPAPDGCASDSPPLPRTASGEEALLPDLKEKSGAKGARKVLKALKHYRKITEKSGFAATDCVDADSLRRFLTYSCSSLAKRFKVKSEKLSFSITVPGTALERDTADMLCATGYTVLHHLLDKYGDKADASTLFVEVKHTASDISMIIREDRDRMLRKVKVDGRDKNPLTFVESMLGSVGGGLSLVRLTSTGLQLLIPRADGPSGS